MAAHPPHYPPMYFDIPEEITEIRDALRPHEYRSWYRHYHDGQREGPVSKGDMPLFILEAAFGEETTDTKDGAVIDAKDPKLESDLDLSQAISKVYPKVNSKEEPEEEEPEEEEPKEEDPDEESEEGSEEDPEDDPEYDPDED
ncbi:protein SHORT ROOT IN SALT MEDIUM 1-like [Eucalyptus grandis]|uniref:protein SHORT ROOT IN SALT MEDIUM 1-like n=1 Tax=Eucalyptus grandis TaxID=71139 RepID=UPI00192E9BA1|nr:protein SHORT ROOT IN SALT MEDIUM 1-like [Eucalyptus grandis]